MTKREAQQEGREVLRRMRGKGWKLHIWENIGWHYMLLNGALSVHLSCNGYFAMISHDPRRHPGMGAAHWTNDYHSRDPNAAAQNAIAEMRRYVKKVDRLLYACEQIYR